MPLPCFIQIDGRRYAWRELVALRAPCASRAAARATDPLSDAAPDSVQLGPAIAAVTPRTRQGRLSRVGDFPATLFLTRRRIAAAAMFAQFWRTPRLRRLPRCH
jgi:hypothetical protein